MKQETLMNHGMEFKFGKVFMESSINRAKDSAKAEIINYTEKDGTIDYNLAMRAIDRAFDTRGRADE